MFWHPKVVKITIYASGDAEFSRGIIFKCCTFVSTESEEHARDLSETIRHRECVFCWVGQEGEPLVNVNVGHGSILVLTKVSRLL